ncbi:MAG: dihydrolipoyl dehydrogenase [Gammaproteobacteria bacterium]|nr:dihydrolipoyl dehydrogenase [Gammaproteobacteria bacterium]MDH5692479.1 dihydrolipoyl dehydrogenase [Gammaproteobacteria bacterium]
MEETFDLVVIGAGPAGYVAAIRGAQLGLKTACVDAWIGLDNKASPGGTCLNVGCIPSKALIDSSENFHHAQHGLAEHGINVKDVSLDLPTMLARKDKVVRELTSGVAALFTANKVKFFHGTAVLQKDKQVDVSLHNDKTVSLKAKSVILATGSRPTQLDTAPYDHQSIVDSTGALSFEQVPKKLGIIGAGVIALELGSVWNRLGADVTLYKTREGLLPEADQAIAKEALKNFEQQGLSFRMGAKIASAKVKAKKVELEYEFKGEKHVDKFDKLIVAIGRKPNSEKVLAKDCGVQVDQKGFVVVDEWCRTAVEGIYAVGDLVRGPMLAHKGEEEGIVAAELAAGHHPLKINLDTVPSVIYTHPEIAWVGFTEERLRQLGAETRVGIFPFAANGRARASSQTDGFVKMISDAHTDRILGVHIIGPQASEMIAQAKLAMDFSASAEDIALTMYAHPTLSEAFHEASFSVLGRAIHAYQPKKKK